MTSKPNTNTIPLDEDEYTAALSSIIKRDFFPDLDRLRAESHFLDALDSHDPALIALAKARLDSIDVTVGALPHTQDGDSLDQFLSKYTSEDNASFGELLADHNARVRHRALKYFPPQDHYHGPRMLLESTSTTTASASATSPRLIQAAPPSSSTASSSTALVPAPPSPSLQLTTTTGPTRPPNHLIPLHDLLPNADHRPSGSVPTWAYKPHNALMFPPTTSVPQPARPRGTTNIAATRFHTPSPLTQLADSIASTGAPPGMPAAPTPAGAPPETPYSLVSMTPRPHGAAASMPPAFTWGAIDATPVAVRDTPPAHDEHAEVLTPGRYRIPETPARDVLAMRMAAKPAATPRGTSASGATPRAGAAAVAKGDVARKLLSRAGGVDGMLRQSYSGRVKKKPGVAGDAGWSVRSTQSAAAAAGIATPFSFTPTPRRDAAGGPGAGASSTTSKV